MDDVPDNIAKKKPGEGMFVVRYIYNNTHMYIVYSDMCLMQLLDVIYYLSLYSACLDTCFLLDKMSHIFICCRQHSELILMWYYTYTCHTSYE